jgi:DNA-binding transcriptional LysR family regulator
MRNKLQTGLYHAMNAFLRVIDSGSFTAAAGQLGLTTAQVSRLVADLETRLGTKLLQRSTQRRTLTDAGRIFAERCREVLVLVAEAEADASGASILPRGVLRVQCMRSFGQRYLAPILADFCRSYPNLTIEYSASQDVPDLLARGADVSLYLSESLPSSTLVARKIGCTFSILCASPVYLTRHDTPRTPKDLGDHPCVRLVNPSHTSAWQLTNPAGDLVTVEPCGPVIADAPDLLVEVLAAGGGIGLLPVFSVIQHVRSGALVRVLADWRSPELGVFALFPSRRFLEAKTRVWLDWVELSVAPRITGDADYFSAASQTA